MRLLPSAVLGAVLVLAGAGHAQDTPKWSSLREGLDAAKKSGRAVLVITSWKNGVCNTCDTWHDRVPKDADVAKQLARFEQVEWQYDGLGGKVISWTREHGGTSDDPAVQAFVVTPDERSVARAPRDTAYVPAEFAKWLALQADSWERERNATKLAFDAAEIIGGKCGALDAARAAGKPVLVYVSRGDRPDADKSAKAQAALCRKLEKSALDSEAAQKAAEGFVLLKLDLCDAAHAALAKSLGAEKAPALLLFAPGDDKPQDLGATIDGASLAFRLKKVAKK